MLTSLNRRPSWGCLTTKKASKISWEYPLKTYFCIAFLALLQHSIEVGYPVGAGRCLHRRGARSQHAQISPGEHLPNFLQLGYSGVTAGLQRGFNGVAAGLHRDRGELECWTAFLVHWRLVDYPPPFNPGDSSTRIFCPSDILTHERFHPVILSWEKNCHGHLNVIFPENQGSAKTSPRSPGCQGRQGRKCCYHRKYSKRPSAGRMSRWDGKLKVWSNQD
jgi:hypothetical protein